MVPSLLPGCRCSRNCRQVVDLATLLDLVVRHCVLGLVIDVGTDRKVAARLARVEGRLVVHVVRFRTGRCSKAKAVGLALRLTVCDGAKGGRMKSQASESTN